MELDLLRELQASATDAYDGTEYGTALEKFELLATEAESAQERAMSVAARLGIGNVYRRQGRYARSLGAFTSALSAAREWQLDEQVVEALVGQGKALVMLTRYEDAIGAYEAALRMLNGSPSHIANAWNGKGEALRMLEDYDAALDSYVRALVHAEASGDPKLIVYSLCGKGDALCGKGDYTRSPSKFNEALASYTNALQQSSDAGDNLGLAYALSGQADAWRMLKNLERAFDAYRVAAERSRATRNERALAYALVGMGETLELTKSRAESRTAYDEALGLGRRLGYGYAITRSQAGIRRIEAAGASHSRVVGNGARKWPKSRSEAIQESRIVSIFGLGRARGISPATRVRRDLLASILPKQGQRVWAVVMMCDIRGYTTIMGPMQDERQRQILDAYLSRGTQIIQRYGGGVDKYMGDAILAFFLPTQLGKQDAVDCCETVKSALRAATIMAEDEELHRLFAVGLNETTRSKFGIGIGLAVGWVEFGEIGASWRREYTLIGLPVSQAARVQSVARPWEVLCTGECWQHVSELGSGYRGTQWLQTRRRSDPLKGMSGLNIFRCTRGPEPRAAGPIRA